tara:strand:- start:1820 stop:3394 length:1575 start_codon:yes stop_codon:yes gene_type:complete
MADNGNNLSGLSVLVTVFFFWGFIAASNGVFIPFCKEYFNLTQFQSQLIDSAFYGAYFFGALIMYLFSSFKKNDLINLWGYKNSIIYGLVLSAIGSVLMIISINYGSFSMILLSLFIIALGFCLQQTSANPFVISLGKENTGPHRLNLAGGINSLGTTIGPIVLSIILFGGIDSEKLNFENISLLYFIVCLLFFVLALFLFKSKKLGNLKKISKVSSSSKATKVLISLTLSILIFTILLIIPFIKNNLYLSSLCLFLLLFFVLYFITKPYITNDKKLEDWGAMYFPQLNLGMLAIFFYVGVEVTIQSNLGALLKTKEFGSISESNNSHFIAMYWGSLMIGRWLGAISVFNPNKILKKILIFIVPFLAFLVVIFFIKIRGSNIDDLKLFSLCVLIQIIGYLISQDKPVKSLIIFSFLAILAMIIGLLNTGIVGVYAFLSGGLFCSIMWPCIFSLSISGLNNYSSQGSSFLIMMILGGAIIPPIQGKIADMIGIHFSYIITIFCFAYILFFAIKIKNILVKQNISN